MMALTSSELTMLSILLQNTPDAVDSTMMKVKKEKLQIQTFIEKLALASSDIFTKIKIETMNTQRKLNHEPNTQSVIQPDSITFINVL